MKNHFDVVIAAFMRETMFNTVLRLFKSKYVSNKISKGFS